MREDYWQCTNKDTILILLAGALLEEERIAALF